MPRSCATCLRASALIDGGGVPWGGMPSPYVFALSLGASPAGCGGIAGAGRAVRRAALAGLAQPCARRSRPRPRPCSTGSLLVSPFLFNYDLTWAALAAGWLALLGLRNGFYRWDREVLLFAWLAPVLMVPTQWATGVQIGCRWF